MGTSGLVLYILGIYLAAVLVASGLAKLVAREEFAAVLLRQGLLPRVAVPATSRAIPVLEVALALGLAFGVAGPILGSLTVGLFAVFLAVATVLFAQGKDADCGCFGVIFKERIDATTILRDCLFVAIAVAYVVLAMRIGPNPWPLRTVTGSLALALICWIIVAPALVSRLTPSSHDRAARQQQHIAGSEEEANVSVSVGSHPRSRRLLSPGDGLGR